MAYVWMAIIGLIAGLIARALHPGDDRLGWIRKQSGKPGGGTSA